MHHFMAGPISLSPNSCRLPFPDPVALCRSWRNPLKNNQVRVIPNFGLKAVTKNCHFFPSLSSTDVEHIDGGCDVKHRDAKSYKGGVVTSVFTAQETP